MSYQKPERLAIYDKRCRVITIFTTLDTTAAYNCETRNRAKALVNHYGSVYCEHKLVNYR